MRTILKAMNNTTSAFGDGEMTKEEINELVETIFKESDVNHDEKLEYAEYMDAVAKHPILVQFISLASGGGGGKSE